ncbi:MAG: tRNA threonylcarbamoyladenosine biosynthesis protein TsaE [Gammaproteobacteria bacterium]|jgi:tRNA threonylcarbamoyladenosine biosynthesis protein TsaE
MITITVRSDIEMEKFGAAVSIAANQAVRIYLSGGLAAGKTTFARGFIRARGHEGAVKSPTFTIVESYELDNRPVHHFDLYRLTDAEELEYIGLDEYFDDAADCLVEWPIRGRGVLPPADIELNLVVDGTFRDIELKAFSEYGNKLIPEIENKYLKSYS